MLQATIHDCASWKIMDNSCTDEWQANECKTKWQCKFYYHPHRKTSPPNYCQALYQWPSVQSVNIMAKHWSLRAVTCNSVLQIIAYLSRLNAQTEICNKSIHCKTTNHTLMLEAMQMMRLVHSVTCTRQVKKNKSCHRAHAIILIERSVYSYDINLQCTDWKGYQHC